MFELSTPVNETQTIINEMIAELKKTANIDIFMSPVDDEDAPNYSEIIKEPISISEIVDNMEDQTVSGMLELKDVLLGFQKIWNNCRAYNNINSLYYRIADKMDRKFFTIIAKKLGKVFLDTYEQYLIDNKIYFKENKKNASDKWLESNLKQACLPDSNGVSKYESKIEIIHGIKKTKKT